MLINIDNRSITVGKPRLPCDNETYEEVKHEKQISVILPYDEPYYEEKYFTERLSECLNQQQIKKLKDYIHFPIKFCEVDLNKYKNHPVYTSSSWLKDFNGKSVDEFRFSKSKKEFLFNNIQINKIYQAVYKDVGIPLQQTFIDITENEGIRLLSLFGNLMDGIQYMQSVDVIHGNICVENIIVKKDMSKFTNLRRLMCVSQDKKSHNNVALENYMFDTRRDLCYFNGSELSALSILFDPESLIARRDIDTSELTGDMREHFEHPEQYISNEAFSHIFETYTWNQTQRRHIEDIFGKFDKWMRMISENWFGFERDEREKLYDRIVDICISRFYGITGEESTRVEFSTKTFKLSKLEKVIKYINSQSVHSLYMLEQDRSLTRPLKEFRTFIERLFHRQSVLYGRDRISCADFMFKYNDLYNMGSVLLDILSNFKRPSKDIQYILRRALRIGIGMLRRPRIPIGREWDEYYSKRRSYFDFHFDEYNDITRKVNALLYPHEVRSVVNRRIFSTKKWNMRNTLSKTTRRKSTGKKTTGKTSKRRKSV
jgi:hypothetical protein